MERQKRFLKGEITFLRENSEELEQADLSEEEKGSLLSEEDLLHMDLFDPRIKWLEKAASSTHNKTQCGLGNFGLGFLYRMDGNEKESFSYFKKAADCGNAGAQRVLGLTYGGSHQAMTASWKDASVAETAGNDHSNFKKKTKNGGDLVATAKAIYICTSQ